MVKDGLIIRIWILASNWEERFDGKFYYKAEIRPLDVIKHYLEI